MNADEIVKALRRMAPQFQAPGKEVINGATDLIESLQAEKETVYMDGIKKAIYEIMKEADIPGSNEIRNSGDTDDGMCAKVSERINAKLAASQRREQAAVKDFEECMKNKKERCAYCMHDDGREPGESLCCANVCGFEWRGPQEAGEETHE